MRLRYRHAELLSPDAKLRLVIYDRDDGRFQIVEERVKSWEAGDEWSPEYKAFPNSGDWPAFWQIDTCVRDGLFGIVEDALAEARLLLTIAAHSPPDWYEQDVVCIAIVPSGQTVDWSPGSYEPTLSLWPPQGTFSRLQSIASELKLEVLATINQYEQSRLSKDSCKALLSRWDEMAVAVERTPGAGWVAAIGLLLRCCVQSKGMELLIEGP